MFLGFPGGSVVKNLPDNAGPSGDAGLIPGLDRSPGGGNGKPFQYSCQDNPLHSGAWQATVHEVAKSWTWLDILYVCAQICFHIDKWPNQYHILLERMFFLPFFLSKDVLSTPQGKENMFSHPLRKPRQPTPVLLPGESQGRGSLLGCRLWGRTESDTTEAT